MEASKLSAIWWFG